MTALSTESYFSDLRRTRAKKVRLRFNNSTSKMFFFARGSSSFLNSQFKFASSSTVYLNSIDLKSLTVNDLAFKQFSTKSELPSDLEIKYNQITKSSLNNAYVLYLSQNHKDFLRKHPGIKFVNY